MSTEPLNSLQLDEPKISRISYSQYSTWANCPHKWKLRYIDGYKSSGSSIYLIFGTAMHTVIQSWLETMYTQSVKASEQMGLSQMLQEEMVKEYKKALEENGQQFSSPKELHKFYENGVAILEWFRKHRLEYYSTKKVTMVGVEEPLDVEIDASFPNVRFRGFMDFVWKDETDGTYYIDDFKTSQRGWTDAAKKDKTKTSQLVLYKEYYAKQLGVSPDKIKIRYIILKQQIWESAEFPQKRIQLFVPADGSVTRKRLKENLMEFITAAFLPNGEYNMETIHPPIPDTMNCKYCEFAGTELCPSGVKSKGKK